MQRLASSHRRLQQSGEEHLLITWVIAGSVQDALQTLGLSFSERWWRCSVSQARRTQRSWLTTPCTTGSLCWGLQLPRSWAPLIPKGWPWPCITLSFCKLTVRGWSFYSVFIMPLNVSWKSKWFPKLMLMVSELNILVFWKGLKSISYVSVLFQAIRDIFGYWKDGNDITLPLSPTHPSSSA